MPLTDVLSPRRIAVAAHSGADYFVYMYEGIEQSRESRRVRVCKNVSREREKAGRIFSRKAILHFQRINFVFLIIFI